MAQYARAKMTRRFEGLPVKMQVPSSFGPSNGRQRIVALYSACTRSSVSRVPSQWAYTNFSPLVVLPSSFSAGNSALNSSSVFAVVMRSSRNFFARAY